ncbi:hypothetical protein HPB50_009806 [Hyalomma asiaticum]|uniref:Uncharacterized protein n=1 Tax=Hyalomma asiaticum TaxID=266040 RepID=A0ACB7RVR8_HYAAI|nr:hypothetical protein HPB50_009806 [Hyalomma asiaticum]
MRPRGAATGHLHRVAKAPFWGRSLGLVTEYYLSHHPHTHALRPFNGGYVVGRDYFRVFVHFQKPRATLRAHTRQSIRRSDSAKPQHPHCVRLKLEKTGAPPGDRLTSLQNIDEIVWGPIVA